MRVLVKAAKLIDGVADAPLHDPVVEIVDGKFGRIGSGQIADAAGAMLIDLGEAVLLPGLIDAHVHLCLNEDLNAREALLADSDESLLLRSAANAQRHLKAGVTTVRDCGGRRHIAISLARANAARVIPGSRVIACAMPICPRRGHLWFMGGEVEDEFQLIDVINSLLDAGAAFIKLMSTGGNFTPGTDSASAAFSLNAMRTAVETAHGRGAHVASHAHGIPGIANSLAAGVDTIEHCTFFGPKGISIDTELVGAIASASVHVVPTMAAAVIRSRSKAGPAPPFFAPIAGKLENVQAMLAAGVKMIAGTDGGVGEHLHGSLAVELGSMVEAGMSPARAIRSATSVSAKVLRIDRSVGSVTSGKAADLLAVRGDPSADISALRNIELVIKDGRPEAGAALAIIEARPEFRRNWPR